MQVTIYLNDKIISKVDGWANRKRQSRSRIITSILEKEIEGKERQSVFNEVFGILTPNEGKLLLKEVRSHRKESKRFR